MVHFLINLRLFKLTYAALAAFAQTIHDGFVAQIADYPTPNPLMADFQDDIDDLNAAITAWGPPGARGSRAQRTAVVDAANIVGNDLRQLAAYAQNVMPDNPTSWGLVGFPVKRAKSAPSALEMVQNFRLFIARDIPNGMIKLKWKRPLDTDPGDVKGYIIQYSDGPVQPQIEGGRGIVNVFGVIPNTSVLITPPYIGANYFWVTPFNAVGYGVSSDPLFYNAPGKV
jgi:hypothetical protein